MNKLNSIVLATVSAAALLSATSAGATALSIGGGWVGFSFGGVGSSWTDTFTFSGPATLKVTDAFLSGDRFSVSDNGVLVGNTSVPGSQGDQIGANYDGAFADARWSHGAFVFGAGNHVITGTAIDSPFGGGGAAVQLIASVPEPATWALMIGGFGLAGATLRRRKAVVA